ncbi:MAG: SUMF1/EgtB/PvdO family nonheme iron enzyme [Motiliproteus sp.]
MVVLPQLGNVQVAIGKFEISVADFNLYCSLSKQCSVLSADSQHPVTGLSSAQVEDYARWLSERTGSSYRLPSVDEWQYAANATSLEQPQDYNCRLTQGGTVLKGRSLIAVKAGRANAWGVVNYLGNAQEVVSQEGRLMAVGGHHKDKMSECAITLSRSVPAEGDGLTGFRLIKEI